MAIDIQIQNNPLTHQQKNKRKHTYTQLCPTRVSMEAIVTSKLVYVTYLWDVSNLLFVGVYIYIKSIYEVHLSTMDIPVLFFINGS